MNSNSKNRIFIEIGANNPEVNSNSFLLEMKYGFKGISIDPLSYGDSWKIKRKNTKFLCALIGNKEDEIDFLEVEAQNGWEDQMSGRADIFEDNGKLFKTKKRKVKSYRLDAILSRENISNINIMLIDVEGSELEVLESNDWSKFRPECLIVENNRGRNAIIRKFLADKQYKFAARVWTSDDVYVRSDLC